MKRRLTKPNYRTNWLVGVWGDPLRLLDVRYEITQRKSGWKVRCWDTSDDEKSTVSKIRLDGHAISFEVYTRSTNYRTINKIRPLNRNRAVHTFTHWETWLKFGPWLLGKKSERVPRSKWIYGEWFDPERFCNREIHVYRTKDNRIALNMGLGIDLSKIRWNGTILQFVSYTPEYGPPKRKCYDFHALRPLSDSKASHQITEDLGLIRYE